MKMLMFRTMATLAWLASGHAAQAQSPGSNAVPGTASATIADASAQSAEPKMYSYEALAESLKSQALTSEKELARKLKQPDVCGNRSTSDDQLCAMAIYLTYDETGKAFASVAPILALVIDELPTSSPSLLPQYKYASAKYLYTVGPNNGALRSYPFSVIYSPRYVGLKTLDGKTTIRKYQFVTVVGYEENRRKRYGIPADDFSIRRFTRF